MVELNNIKSLAINSAAEEETFICPYCNVRYPVSASQYVEDEQVCDYCYDDYFITCFHCGDPIRPGVNAGDERTALCRHCYDNYYTMCEHCDHVISNDNAYSSDDGEYVYCEDCYNQYSIKSIHDYSYKPEPIFYGNNRRYFGVELEVDGGGMNGNNADQILDIANKNAEHLYIKTDGSLDDGFEIVTHPCTLDYHINDMPWEDIVHHALKLGYLSHKTDTCGLHIHVNKNAFSDDYIRQDACIGRVLYHIEKHWEELLKFSRRTEAQLSRWAARYGLKDNPKDILEHAKNGCGGRYTCLNLDNYFTIEFRLFRGTLRYNSLIETLQMVDAICEAAFSLSDEEIAALSWTSFVERITASELIAYLKERRLYINEPVEITEEEL